jgi:hypothetical protein
VDVNFLEKRRPNSEDDFGDEETIGLHLKKRQLQNCETEFGVYLGKKQNRKERIMTKRLKYLTDGHAIWTTEHAKIICKTL